MIIEANIEIPPELLENADEIKRLTGLKLQIATSDIRHIVIRKRSIDARHFKIRWLLILSVYINEDYLEEPVRIPDYGDVSSSRPVAIIGAGPAGLFAALRCIELGLKPVIFERGKDIKARVHDLKQININHLVNEDSNYCFGEGGAGTYSDGKLYTRSKKRGDTERILRLLVAFGAHKNILIDAHPHIGTNVLPGIIKNIRECILQHGGEIFFNRRLTDILIKNGCVSGIILSNGDKFNTDSLLLATGHSAKDVYELLYQKKIDIELKTFALGVRIEHPQSLIDEIQYKRKQRGVFLPPATYSLVKQINGRGVYSFCMCPGGVIAPCATRQNEIVTNGWSPSRRDFPTANSGIVVELKNKDFKKFEKYNELAAMYFQQSVEHKAWVEVGKSQKAPAQRLTDFLANKNSYSLPQTSYKPGISSVNLKSVLPEFIESSLKSGFIEFGKMMKGYITEEAVLHAPESRTSSPVRIPRDINTGEHIRIKGLYPCGEGAGYAGGIISAAIDGERCIEHLFQNLKTI